jgi:signal transduction histidine kinase/ActR/RegA family two-component response regulator
LLAVGRTEFARTFRSWPYLAGVLGLAAAYFAAAKLGLSLGFVKQVSVVWPPTGIALAAFLLGGCRLWPGVWLGAFLANVRANEPPLVACGIAVGNTLEGVVGAILLRRLAGFRRSLERLKDVLGLVVLAAGLSTTVSATVGVTSLCLGGVELTPGVVARWSDFGRLWWVWWFGDAMGNLVIAPVLLTWVVRPRAGWDPQRAAEAAALVLALGALCVAVFTGAGSGAAAAYPLEYTTFPFVIWAALRFGPRGWTAVPLLVLVVAILATRQGWGPFAGRSPQESLILLHVYMAVVAVTSLLLGGVMTERRLAERRRATTYAVTAILAESTSLAEAAPRLLEVIGGSLEWEAGAVWVVDRQADVLRCVEVWHRPSLPVPAFEEATRGRTFARGAGLPGQVWSAGRPVWIADVTCDDNFPRAPAAARDGLHGALGLPVVWGTDFLGVLEFFSRRVEQADEEILRLLAAVGGQVGLFLERKRDEEALREADRRKDAFLAMLAHELRNPLAPVRTAVGVLKMAGPAEPPLAQAREMIERQVAHMARLIDDLLDVSRIGRGRILLRRQPLDLARLARDAVEDHRRLLEETGLKLLTDFPDRPMPILGDPTRLAQVVGNLVQNAAKFTDAGGVVEVRLATEPDGRVAVLSVRDTGIGMEADLLGRLFEPFSQADRSLDRSRGGLGLGLALVKGLVELHGGTILAASPGLDRGSEFTVRLPLNPALSPPAPSERAPPAPSGASLQVLIVEDNRDAAESLRLLLEMQGYRVVVAHTGRAALEVARREPPDLVLCDIGLPGGMDGYALARALRTDSSRPSPHLIALSGYGQEEDQRRAHEAGFARHLTKPVDPAVLSELLDSLAARAGG